MKTIGILGGGQLGRMLALAGFPLDLRFRFMDPAADAPVDLIAWRIVADYTDESALVRITEMADAITYEVENVPVAAARFLAAHVPVFPPPAALEAAQDRFVEKSFLQGLGIPTPPFAEVSTRDDLERAVTAIGLPAVLKTRRMGYDGKGQVVVRAMADLDAAWTAIGMAPAILEGFVDFDRELAVLAARGRDGHIVIYPLVWNTHRAGILRMSIAPAPTLSPALQSMAEDYMRRVLTELDYVGVLAIELFQVGDGLLANEMAPRVHNSGHWTIEGAETSQFENHLRAVIGLPLGAANARGHSAMLNLIGGAPASAAVLAVPGAHLHLYDKSPRPGRKIGHITLRTDDPADLATGLAALRPLVDASAEG